MTTRFVLPFVLLTGFAFAQANADRNKAAEYRSKAEKLEEKAAKHEAEADRLAKASRSNPMLYKWPALAQGPAERERRLAMQARRAAAESREIAAKHEAKAIAKTAEVE